MIKYTGRRTTEGLRVTLDQPSDREDDQTLRRKLAPRQDLRKHSGDFETEGDAGGRAQLALAICADHLSRHALRAEAAAVTLGLDFEPRASLSDRVALRVYQTFKARVIAILPRDAHWSIPDAEVGTAIDHAVNELREYAHPASGRRAVAS